MAEIESTCAVLVEHERRASINRGGLDRFDGMTFVEIQRVVLERALVRANHSVFQAARQLHVSRCHLVSLLRSHGLSGKPA